VKRRRILVVLACGLGGLQPRSDRHPRAPRNSRRRSCDWASSTPNHRHHDSCHWHRTVVGHDQPFERVVQFARERTLAGPRGHQKCPSPNHFIGAQQD
jgi:hypothetical protein